MKLRIILALILLQGIAVAHAQKKVNTDSLRTGTVVGFNANAMLSQIVPFNSISNNVPAPSIILRTIKNGHGFRLAVGFDLDQSSAVLNNLYGSIGYTAKRGIGKNFYWIKGVDARFYASEVIDEGAIALSPYWGVEYNLNNVISFSTETHLDIGYGLFWGEPIISLKPPTIIQCHFKIK